ncbi:hypothetical protein P280DRAFT_474535 [Massarina eburnea CBS 473.64]|uniref:THUMP domain-containing protein n=1 Tax=Massarina eburnea CBS 473.64 TaxID=1395130 RepID=A0A6A6RKQ4_9PLEO|nr:hypothetical protein P280DRAFT_474535 [Massarina eburnea CBS 473.64]
MAPGSGKRKADHDRRDEEANKKHKHGKKNRGAPPKTTGDRGLQPGDMGIWATCALKKEAPSIADLRDLFQEYTSQLYGESQADGTAEDQDSDDEGDIESAIQKEIEGIRKPTKDPFFKNAQISTACLVFFKARKPVEPVKFVQNICQDVADGKRLSRCNFVKRLTPIEAMDKATDRGLEDVARQVIAPHFHGADQARKKFAIRVSIRNNKQFTRDVVIQTVASVVGPGHKVDLSGYDLLILVEIYQNMIGMSVVGPDFEKLRRFNIAELRDASRSNEQDTSTTADKSAQENQPATRVRVEKVVEEPLET